MIFLHSQPSRIIALFFFAKTFFVACVAFVAVVSYCLFMENTTNQISTKIATQYAALNSAHNKAAHAYHNAMSTPAETDAGLALNMAARAVKSFEERHPEVVAE